jgi:histidinol-phosphate aminotransferase
VHAWRSFEAYPIAAAASGGALGAGVPLGPGARHDVDAMADAVTERTRVVLVCTPNNPTGPAVGAAELAALCDRVPDDVLVVVDEAYAEFVRDDAAADGLAAFANATTSLCSARSPRPMGWRACAWGYALAPATVATAVRTVALPFGVSGVAQAAAVASCVPRPSAS